MNLSKFDAQILNNSKLTMFLCLMVLLISAIGAKNLYFRGDYKVFFEADNPQRLAYENMQQIFSKNESASILIAARDGDLFNQQSLSLIKELTDMSWQVPLSTRVDSITNFQRSYAEQDDLIVEDLVLESDWLTPDYIKTVKKVSLSEPELLNKLISPDGKVALINITVQLPDGDQTKEINEIGNYLRAAVAPYVENNPDYDIRLTGLVIMTDSFLLAAQKDAMTLFPAMLAIFAILLSVLMRSVLATVATLIIVTASIAATMGVGGWLGMFINIATVNVPVIIMTLAIADCVHIISGTRYYMQTGQNQQDAILSSLALNRKAIIITSVTTAVGFLTLNFARVPVLDDMGNLVAIGVIFACLFSLILLPVILNKFTLKFKATAIGQQSTRWDTLTLWLAKNCKIVLVAAFGLTIASAFLVTQNKLNDIPIEYFNEGNDFRNNAEFQQEKLTGLTTVDLAIYTDKDNGILEPRFLEVVEKLTAWLEQQSEVDHVISFSNVMKRLNMNMNADDPTAYQLPAERDLAAQYLLLYEMSLPFGLDVNNQIDINKSGTRLMVTTQNLGSNELTDLEARAKRWLNEEAPEYRLEGASIPLIFAHIGKQNMQSIAQGTAVALILISVLLFFALKSFKLGAISILPNVMPAVFGFAIWAIISGNISMALAVVMIMPLGIIVDDTVHFLVKYQSAQKQGLSNVESVTFAYKNVSRALIVTTIVLASGFGVLAFSDFAINSEMGTLTAIIIVLALIVDLIVLPAALLAFSRDKKIA
ncbi:RND family transporter [Glaciecola sp. SC05]|uniref:efflux RND transporter permease subunit n=1 Tax=Glaciecola sp. SC05 TaxID=1987355 RepID=UPI003527453B